MVTKTPDTSYQEQYEYNKKLLESLYPGTQFPTEAPTRPADWGGVIPTPYIPPSEPKKEVEIELKSDIESTIGEWREAATVELSRGYNVSRQTAEKYLEDVEKAFKNTMDKNERSLPKKIPSHTGGTINLTTMGDAFYTWRNEIYYPAKRKEGKQRLPSGSYSTEYLEFIDRANKIEKETLTNLDKAFEDKDYYEVKSLIEKLNSVGTKISEDYTKRFSDLRIEQTRIEKEGPNIEARYNELRTKLQSDLSEGKTINQATIDELKKIYTDWSGKKLAPDKTINLIAIPEIPKELITTDAGITTTPTGVTVTPTETITTPTGITTTGITIPTAWQEEIEKFGATPTQITSFREELLQKPTLQAMSPEYRNYIQSTLEGIGRATQETVRTIETGAARAGLSPYAQRAVMRATEEGAYRKVGAKSELELQDLERRFAELSQREAQRRGFLESEYTTTRDISLKVAEMMQKRQWETEDEYKKRTDYLRDQLVGRGWSLEDISSAQTYATGLETQRQEWQKESEERQRAYYLLDQARQRRQQLEDYEQQKRDYYAMLEQTKAKEQQWWEPLLPIASAVAGSFIPGVGTELGYAIGSGLSSSMSGTPSRQNLSFPTINQYYRSPYSTYPTGEYNYLLPYTRSTSKLSLY